MNEVEQILSGSGYFYCNRGKCTLKYEICIKRQQMHTENPNLEQYIMCEKCSQGIENTQLLESPVTDIDAQQPQKHGEALSSEPKKKIPRCEICGKNPRPLFGRHCNSCIEALVSQPGYMEGKLRQIEARVRERERRRKDFMIRYIFSRSPEVLDAVTKLSALEERSLDEQVIFMVKAQVNENNLQSCTR